MPNTMTVGVLAHEAGVTPKTVRYYEARSLLPAPVRGANGYRYYGWEALNRLRFIQRAKALGLSLSEISDLVQVAEHGHCGHTQAELDAILTQKVHDCSRRIDELMRLRATLTEARQRLSVRPDHAGAQCDCPGCAKFDPSCECIPVPVEPAP